MSHVADHLRAIHNFDELIQYLEDRLDWPLQGYEYEDITYEYEPQELGLKDEDAAKVKNIRPVVSQCLVE